MSFVRSIGLVFALTFAIFGGISTRAQAATDCVAETRALEAIGRGVTITVEPPSGLTADSALNITWRAKARAPLKLPLYVAIAIPGEVRFWLPPLPPQPRAAVDALYEAPKPDLPGFLALSPEARGPLGLEFGRGETRALVPLHQPGARLAGAFEVRNLAAGETTIRAAVVARTPCGERLVSASFDRTFRLVPGAPQIVVQDPYDIDQPNKVIISKNGHYRAHIFDRRYRVYDIRTGAKLVDRAGTDVNFSPGSRFIVANAGSAGQAGEDAYEAVDLASSDVIAGLHDPFIGFSEGNSYLLDGRASFGWLFIRPMLISRAVASRVASDEEATADRLTIDHWGSCHACVSWTDDAVALDLDNGVLAYAGGQPLADNKKICLYELASGLETCGGQQASYAQLMAKYYQVETLQPLKGWTSRSPFQFSHIYDPANYHVSQGDTDDTSNKIAKSLAMRWERHKTVDPKLASFAVAALESTTVVRGDWRSHIDRTATDGRTQQTVDTPLSESEQLGLVGPAPLARADFAFVNSSLSADRVTYWDGNEAEQHRIDTMIARRTAEISSKLISDVPAVAARLGNYTTDNAGQKMLPQLPYEDLEHGKIYLEETLEGAWRWQVQGRPVWLLQLWATEGNGGIGQGVMTLLLGDRADGPKNGGRVVDLTMPLKTFWAGQYGATDQQSQLKPQIFLDRYLVLASVAAATIAVYDLDRLQPVRVFSDLPQADLLANVLLSPDVRHVIQINSDGQFFLHKVASGHLALSGRTVDDEIIAYTPEGYYWSSYEGAHFVQFRFPGLTNIFSFQQFAQVLDRPDIVQARLHSSVATAAPPPKLVPPPSLTVTVVTPGGVDRRELRVAAQSSNSLARLRIFADGQLVDDIAMSGNDVSQVVPVVNTGDARWLTAQVSDASGLISAPQSIRLAPPATPTRRLFAVLVGNDHYANPQYTLEYASHDAERLGAVLAANPGHAYLSSKVKVLANQAATRDAILSELDSAVATAEPGDTVLFSFAGHGIDAPEGYYLTPSGFDERRIADTALAWRDVAEIIRRAKSRVIVILDACHAGLTGQQGLGTNDQALAALISGAHPPMLVLAASKGRQSSYEAQRWDGGAFTFALIKVLQSEREQYDLDRDGAIEVSELYRGLRTILSRETGDRQSPWLVREDLIGDFAVF